MGRLDGHITLITGAGRGFGHGIARRMAAEGAHVIAVARSAGELADLVATVLADGGRIEAHAVDLGDAAALDRLTAAVLATHGRVDSLVNNAAVLRMTAFLDLPAAAFDETVAVNLLAPVRLIRAFLPGMVDRGGGAIVNVSSAAGVRPFVDETDYCATKYGLEGYSYSLAMELAPRGVSVNLVSPGYRIKPTSVSAAEFAAWPPERRAEFRDPIDMADAFTFLALQAGDAVRAGTGVTGQRFNAADLTRRLHEEGWDWHQRPVAITGDTAKGAGR